MSRLALIFALLVCVSCASADTGPMQKASGNDGKLKVTETDGKCFAVERTTQGGGLKIPNQTVCPIAK